MTSPTPRTGNRLLQEQSPYLQQHAFNPVDWYPWGDEALTRAKIEDRPILLSIGYSTCHWCHVMEHETFENPDAARVMNELFVNIKVDREEHPDLDGIYMQASQALTGYGGWPLNVWLTPDLEPFYSGGYMPPYAQGSHPGFIQLCQIIVRQYTEQRERVREIGGRVREALESRPDAMAGGITTTTLRALLNHCQATFDSLLGGFGRPPKFPPGMLLTLLIRESALGGPPTLQGMITKTLDAMAHGGIYDQAGGGFHRYSTDAQWLVPHFEKMLYDNALLARAYAEAYNLLGLPLYRDITRETLDYVLRDMTHPEGGFYSAEDADSVPPGPGQSTHKEEGAFYTYSPAEFAEALGTGLPVDLLAELWDISGKGNFEGKTILNLRISVKDFAQAHQLDETEFGQQIAEAKSRLRTYRSQRERPHLDDKILTSWNGLMIGSMAYAATVLKEPRYLDAARKAADFVLSHLRDENGDLLRRWRNGEGRFAGTLEDYAWFAYGLFELYEATLEDRFLLTARELALGMVDRFADPAGGFFLTTAETEHLLVRPKDLFDNATPSGNSVAATVCARMYVLTGEARWRNLAEGCFTAAGEYVERAPSAFGWLLQAWQYLNAPPIEIVLVGDLDHPQTQAQVDEVRLRPLPHQTLLLATPEIAAHFPLAADRPMVDGQPTVYICRNHACQQPTTDMTVLQAQIIELRRSVARKYQESRDS